MTDHLTSQRIIELIAKIKADTRPTWCVVGYGIGRMDEHGTIHLPNGHTATFALDVPLGTPETQ